MTVIHSGKTDWWPYESCIGWGFYPRVTRDLGCMVGGWLEGSRSREFSLCQFLLIHSSMKGVSSSVLVSLCSFLQIHKMTSHSLSLFYPFWHTPLHTVLQAHLHTCLPLIAIKRFQSLFIWVAEFFSDFAVWNTNIWVTQLPPRQKQAFVSCFTSIQGLQSSPNVFLMKTASSHHSVSI